MTSEKENPKIILASKSPRRKELLELLGLSFDVVPADIDERKLYDLKPEQRAEQLALLKAKEVAKKYPEAVIISADSFGVLEDEVLEKLDRIMTNAFNAVADLAKEKKCFTRDAAYLIAIQRVARAVEGRGWVKTKK